MLALRSALASDLALALESPPGQPVVLLWSHNLAAAQANVGSEPPTGFDSASSLAPQSYSRLACYRATNMLWQK